MPIGPKQSSKLPSLFVQHAQVQVNKLQVTGGSRVISSSQLSVKSLGHGTNTCVDLHTHLSHSVLQRIHHDFLALTIQYSRLRVERGSTFTFSIRATFIHCLYFTRVKFMCVRTEKNYVTVEIHLNCVLDWRSSGIGMHRNGDKNLLSPGVLDHLKAACIIILYLNYIWRGYNPTICLNRWFVGRIQFLLILVKQTRLSH